MSKYTPLKLVKTTASIFAAAALVACGGGGSGGGSMQPVGTIKVSDEVSFEDQITVCFTGSQSGGFSAILDGINVTALFSDVDFSEADEDADKTCKKSASVYALQGILGEKAQAGGKSTLVAKATGRSDVSKSFTFKAWPEVVIENVYPDSAMLDIYNSNIVSIEAPEGSQIVDGQLGLVFVEDKLQLSITGESGLVNSLGLAKLGVDIEDDTVIRLPLLMDESHLFSDLLKAYLDTDEDEGVTISLVNCDGANSLCVNFKVGAEEIKVRVNGGESITATKLSPTEDNKGTFGKIKELIEGLGQFVLEERTNDKGVTEEVSQINFKHTSQIHLTKKIDTTSLSFNAINYFAAPVSNSWVDSQFPIDDNIYLALSSNGMNQRMLAHAHASSYENEGSIKLCANVGTSEEKCGLRDLATKELTSLVRGLSPLITATDAKRAAEAALPKDAKINYTVKYANAPYLRYLADHAEVGLNIEKLEFVLEPKVTRATVCGAITDKTVKDACQGTGIAGAITKPLNEGFYAVEVKNIMLKQRVLLTEAGNIEVSPLLETSVFMLEKDVGVNGKPDKIVGLMEAKESLDAAMTNKPDALLKRKEILPALYGLLGQLPLSDLASFDADNLDTFKNDVCISSDEVSVKDVMDKLFGGDGKFIALKEPEVKVDRGTGTEADTHELQHLVFKGQLMLTDKENANITIIYKESCGPDTDPN